MSKRHKHRETVLPPKVEIRAHAHNERHRVNSELHLVADLVSHGVEPDGKRKNLRADFGGL